MSDCKACADFLERWGRERKRCIYCGKNIAQFELRSQREPPKMPPTRLDDFRVVRLPDAEAEGARTDYYGVGYALFNLLGIKGG